MQEQTAKKEVQFVKLSDLTSKDVKGLQRFPVKMTRNLKFGRQQVSILLCIDKDYFPSLTLRAGGPKNFITPEKFNLILLEANFDMRDPKGKEITEWNKQVICRFVKGRYSNRDAEYKSLEVIFKQGLYITHFFDFEQERLLSKLEETGKLKITWFERPDAIEEDLETITFN